MVVIDNPQDITNTTKVYFNELGDRACVADSIEEAAVILNEPVKEVTYTQVGICVYELVNLNDLVWDEDQNI